MPSFVIPAKAGIQRRSCNWNGDWIPAFAGMTGNPTAPEAKMRIADSDRIMMKNQQVDVGNANALEIWFRVFQLDFDSVAR